jgi:hypothetical protein
MAAEGWRKRHIADLQSEIEEFDRFEEVMAARIIIEEEIAMIEAMIINAKEDTIALNDSLAIAREKLKNLK